MIELSNAVSQAERMVIWKAGNSRPKDDVLGAAKGLGYQEIRRWNVLPLGREVFANPVFGKAEAISLHNLIEIGGDCLGEVMAGWMQRHHESAELHAIASLIELAPTPRRQRTASAKCRQSCCECRVRATRRGLAVCRQDSLLIPLASMPSFFAVSSSV